MFHRLPPSSSSGPSCAQSAPSNSGSSVSQNDMGVCLVLHKDAFTTFIALSIDFCSFTDNQRAAAALATTTTAQKAPLI